MCLRWDGGKGATCVHARRVGRGEGLSSIFTVRPLQETAISKLLFIGEQITQAGMKRSAEQQAASSKGDWLNGSKLS